MSSHYKFEVHVRTPGESDDEPEIVERLAQHVRELAAMWALSPGYRKSGVEIDVHDVQRT